MENQVNIDSQNNQQIGQNEINQSMEVQEKPKINYWIISTIILLFLLGIAGLFFLNVKTKKEQSSTQTLLPTETPIATNVPNSIPQENSLYLGSYQGRKAIFLTNEQLSKYYDNGVEKTSPTIGRLVTIEGTEQHPFDYTKLQNPKRIFTYPSPSSNIPQEGIPGKLPQREILINYQGIGDFVFNNNKIFLSYKDFTDPECCQVFSYLDLNTEKPEEKVIKKEKSPNLLVLYKPVSISPKESYLLIIQYYEYTFVPLNLLKISTGEFTEIPITVNLENRIFEWDPGEKSVIFDYYRVKNREAVNIEFESGKVRYSLETGKLEYL